MAGPRPIATTLSAVTSKVLSKRGAAFGGLLLDWQSIVGKEVSGRAVPEKLSFPVGKKSDATLTLRVPGAFAPMMQHKEPWILERINAYFGFRAVARLKFVQSPTMRAAAQIPDAPKPNKAMLERVGDVGDDELQAALARLGMSIAKKKSG